MFRSILTTSILWAWAFGTAQATVIYQSGFEGTDGGWVGTNDWMRAIVGPFDDSACDMGADYAPGPSGAASGSQAWGTVINGCHNNLNATSSLSQTFDLTGYTSASFSWDQFLQVFYDFDTAQLIVNGDLLYETTTRISTGGWELQTVDLTPYVGGLASIQFDMFATSVVNRAGWYVDNVSIDAISGVPAPATLALFGLGLAGLGWSRRTKA